MPPKPLPHPPRTAAASDPGPSPEILLRLYRTMVLTRAMDERGMMAQRQGRIGFYVPSLGQEGASVGAASALEPEDWLFPTYRDHGMALWRGVSLHEFVCQLYGNAEDPVKGRQMPNHFAWPSIRYVSVSSPICTQLPQAVGAGMAAKYRGDGIVVLAGLGDGGTSSAEFHAAMNFAAVFRAPVIFFCQNNGYAISVPVSRQTASGTLAQKAEGYGMPGVRVDGNDALAVRAAVKQAADRARAGGGPTFVEALTFRAGPHSSSDDPSRYVPQRLAEEWAARDPIPRLRRVLEEKKLIDPERDRDLWREARETVQEAFRRAEPIAPPAVETLFTDVYAEIPPHLHRQMRALRDELAEAGVKENTSEAFPL